MTKKHSPVVRSDSRFSGYPDYLHVQVRFRDKSDLDELIKVLTELRDTQGDDFDHVHLQHYDYERGSSAGHAEVTFYRPEIDTPEIEVELMNETSKLLSELRVAQG